MDGWQKAKSDQVYQLAKRLVELNASIDYVATQTHISLSYLNYTDKDGNPVDYLSSVRNNSERIAALGLDFEYSEVTVGCDEECEDRYTPSKEDQQAQLYKGLLQICVDLYPQCTVFQMWGAVDGWTKAYTGLNVYVIGIDYQPKKAWYAMMDVLEGTGYWMSVWDKMHSANDDEDSSEDEDEEGLSSLDYIIFGSSVGAAAVVGLIALKYKFGNTKILRHKEHSESGMEMSHRSSEISQENPMVLSDDAIENHGHITAHARPSVL